ncbi:MAG: hypothetical protein L0154_22195 [Chloroflexi bacterium]|nr:hypothetical protein [Chloroflexota bacterium]
MTNEWDTLFVQTFRVLSLWLLVTSATMLLARRDPTQPYMLLIDGTPHGRQLFIMSADGKSRENISRTLDSVNYYGLSSDGSWLYFESGNSPWGLALYRVRINGGMKEPLLAEELLSHYRFMQPGLAPNGAQLAYFRLTGSDTALHILTEDNRHVTFQLPLDSITDNVIWTLEGRWILFLGSVDRKIKLFRANIHGYETLLDLDSSVRFDNLSPDGEWLAVQSSTGYFALINVNTANIVRLRSNIIEFLGWSADGDRFFFRTEDGIAANLLATPQFRILNQEWAYISVSPYHDVITVLQNDGTTRISERKGPLQYFFTPLGERYFFNDGWQYFEDGNIYRQRPDGSDRQSLTDFRSNEQITTWSPDQQWLYFTTTIDVYTRVMYRMRPDGSNMQKVTSHSSVVSVNLAPGGFVTWIHPPEQKWNYQIFLFGWLVFLVGSVVNRVYNRSN